MSSLIKKIISHVQSNRYAPSTIQHLKAQLRLTPEDAKLYDSSIRKLLKEGTLVSIKRGRLCYSKDANLVSGKIYFRNSGSAFIIKDEDASEKLSHAEKIEVLYRDTGVALHGDRVMARLKIPKRNKRCQGPQADLPDTAHVMRVLERVNKTLTGTFRKNKSVSYVEPDDPRIVRDILISKGKGVSPKNPKSGDKVVVELDEWKKRHLNPLGIIVQILGKTHTPKAEFKAILHRYKLSPEFPEAIQEAAKEVPRRVAQKAIGNRVDCRDLMTLTIDPDDAKDFDDALSLEKLALGKYRVGIHIADVATYIPLNSPLDKEAYQRGNSSYLVGKVIPMLPENISNGICSLVENEDRLTKSVFLTFNARGKIVDTSFANTVIRSNKRLTYRQALALLKETSLKKIRATPLPPKHQTGSIGVSLDELSDSEIKAMSDAVKRLWKYASVVRKQRIKEGSLDLDMPEVKIFVDNKGYADRIERVEYDESHQLIEEYMLLANQAVARALFSLNFPFISRVHDEPDTEKLDELREELLVAGIRVGDLNQRKYVGKLMAILKKHDQGHSFKLKFLRSMKMACYRASADGHYGLNMPFYAHFTSPIRRYSDLIVHRIFDRYLVKTKNDTAIDHPPRLYRQSQLNTMSLHISHTEMMSTEAERESVKIKLLEFFEREAKAENKKTFEATIVDITSTGIFVELKESMAYGLIRLSSIKDDLYTISQEGDTVIGRKHRRRFGVGDCVEVYVARVDRFKRQIDFSLIE